MNASLWQGLRTLVRTGSFFWAATSCAFSLLAGRASAADDSVDRGTLSIYFENDAFAGTDRYYTSGAKIGWTSPDLRKYDGAGYHRPYLPLIDDIPFVDDSRFQKNMVVTIGQNIYTPDNTEAFGPVPGDRPYAGWLYGGLGVAWKNERVRNSVVLNLGVVGPWSYGEETQQFVHDQLGNRSPNGWDNQLRNELGVVLTYERTWRFPRIENRAGLGWEILPQFSAAAGNVLTAARLGTEMRFGLNLPDDFGDRSIGPDTTTSTPVEGFEQAARPRFFDFGMYAFARADGSAVAHNIFLDGNTFANSLSVDKEPLVADLSVGVAMNFGNTKIAYAFVYRTEEFKTQVEPQVFGTISINWPF